ncbi:similar to alpha,alpha-trehalose-phosphate synthase subunit Tps2 [Plenodomus lingam JN3]|uniref:Similar to alpha,alpha-trehalose-phosphate synthase subunit Tps2 n=2 Tax=Leptosphaeria maculans TaxID=5022 RepID=E5AFC4_LEPMJ|nr:similar to alpha,alpha-trehalose-phosphate synthase subunit Tps2 [Plenodomus lingam JN3]CBY01913.1 similar to alpha,alpha-trehalose-phosphate synthase subunit Tps2 [Plenodomus lingam JN3]
MAPPTNPEGTPKEPFEPRASQHPALHPDITNVPVTPGVHLDGGSAYFENPATNHDNNLPFDPETATPGPSWNANSYFSNQQRATADAPTEASAGARTEGELSEKLGSVPIFNGKKDLADTDPRAAHPGLNLSGGVISATFAIPYSLGFSPGNDWEMNPRRGTSALFDSFSYLASSSSPWNHTLVGWTGELASATAAGPAEAPINRAAAPIPVDPKTPIPAPQQPTGMRIGREDRERLERQLERDHGGKIVPVWLVDEVDEGKDEFVVKKDQSHWRTYAEHELYTMFHYKQNEPADGRAARKSWADYYRMNKLFADKILEIYKPGDIVLVHDYPLLLLPSLLRQRLPNIYIGFFLHIPFPSSEFYRCLSRRKEILEGVLGANMIGFQSYSYSRHFSSCCTRILGFDSSSAGVDAYGAHVAVDVFPIGINAVSTQRQAFGDPEIDERIKGIREMYAGKRIIVGRDRLDAVRGVVQKLQAFEMFFEKYPEWQGKVVLIQVTSPSGVRTDRGDGAQEKVVNKISDLAAKINGVYGTLDYTPVRHFPQYLSREEYFALLRIADIGLITSVRDGMNTTSMEYVICQKDNHGPLILSEFSGTAGSLSGAIHINPWDLGGVADAINGALKQGPEERAEQHKRLYNHVVSNNVQSWTNNYLKKLMTNLSSFDQSFATPVLDRAKLLFQYRQAKKRLFMFDYDGTLTPIVQDPSAALPSDRVTRTLKMLAADPANSVWIISGRDQAFLNEYLGHIPELGLSAEHGSFMRNPRSDVWENLTEKTDMSWQQEVLDIFQHYTDCTQGAFIERKKIALTWHYRRADPEYGAFQARECQKHLERTVAKKYDVEVMTGKANLEVRPKFVNKGEIAKRLVHEYGSRPGEPPEFVLCLGDDFTDEDMFRSLRQSALPSDHVFSVTVGASSKQTLASWHLVEPSDVISVISLLNGAADAGNVGAVAVVDGTVPESRAQS